MSEWCVEPRPAMVNEEKRRFFAQLPEGSVRLDLDTDALPGTWWRLEENGRTIGYGWMDVTWGDAQVMFAVAPEVQGSGHGAAILDHLEHEANAQGLGFLFNSIPADHPDPDGVKGFLTAHRFVASGLDGGLLRRRVRR